MADIPRIAVRSPQPFDIVGDSFTLCGLGVANEGVLGSVTEVRNPNTTTYTTRSHEGASGVNTITISKTIDVTLDCT